MKNENKSVQQRTDPNLRANLEDDLDIIKRMSLKLLKRHKSQVIDKDDLFQFLCETYLEAMVSYKKKPRTIPERPFVFNYINFILMRRYRGQFKFENRDVFCSEIVLDPNETIEYEFNSKDSNPYLFENSYDLSRVLAKYTYEERLIIYYRFFLEKPLNEIKRYVPGGNVSYIKVKKLKQTLKNDADLIELLKEF